MAKYEQLYSQLRDEIITLSPGDAFPSLRTLMKSYSVSQATVSKATEKLFSEGFLHKVAGREMVVTDEVCKYKSGAPPIICLAIPHWQSDWNSTVEHDFFEQQSALGYELEVVHYDWHRKVIHELPQKKIDGLVVIPSAGMISADEIKALDNFDLPYVLFARHLSGLSVNCVSADNRHFGAIAANHLIELGHKSIAVIITQPRFESIDERIDGFRSMCELRGVDFVEVDCDVSDGDYAVEKVYQKFSRMLAGGSLIFTGAMTMCQDSCAAIYRAFYENNRTIPDDLNLIGVGSHRLYDYFYPPLTSLGASVSEMVKTAVDILIPRGTGDDTRGIVQKQIKPILNIQGSTSRYIESSKA